MPRSTNWPRSGAITAELLRLEKNKTHEGLAGISHFSQGLTFLLGHNIRKHDLPHLRAAKPELALLSWPVIDTLWLNPLAFPRNPYHRLVKHYQDGQLSRGQLNNPELDADWDWSKVAVIAREWKYLEPVRAYCEHFGVPMQMANEQAPSLWRMRETQRLIRWINERDSTLVSIKSIQQWLSEHHHGPWWEQLSELVADLSLELGGSEIPCQHFIETVVEWGREIRRSQKALLLTTAHRAKGLEFDHVLVLDGAWEKVGKNEDTDASRRLYYVAMSRARQTLTLMQMPALNPFLNASILDSPVILKRQMYDVAPDVTKHLQKRYLTLTLKDVDIGYAGRLPKDHLIHKRIAAIQPNDQLTLRFSGSKWALLDSTGETVGCLAKSFAPPLNMKLESCRVYAIMQRGRTDTPDDCQHTVTCDEWEVLLPELTYSAE